MPGDDAVADRGAGAVVQRDLAAGIHGAVEDQVGAGALVEGLDGLVRVADEYRRSPGLSVGPPRAVGGVDHRLRLPPCMRPWWNGVDGFGVAVAQAEEAVFSQAFVKRCTSTSSGASSPVADEQGEHATGIDGLELGVVADEQYLGSGLGGEVGDAVEGQASSTMTSCPRRNVSPWTRWFTTTSPVFSVWMPRSSART